MPRTGQRTEFISRQSVLFIWEVGAVQACRKSPATKAAVRNTPLLLWLSGKQWERKRAPRFPNPTKATLSLLDAVVAKGEMGSASTRGRGGGGKFRQDRGGDRKEKKSLWRKNSVSVSALDSCLWPRADAHLVQFQRSGPTHLRSPSRDLSRATATQCWHWELLCLGAFSSSRTRGSRGGGGGAATSHTHKNQIHMYVSLHMHVHPSLENCFWRALATHTMGSFLQYVLNSCQSSGIWGQNVSTFSYVIPESLISLLDRFSDVQLCFLSTDVQHFCVCLHNISEAWLCRGWKKKKKKASWNKGNITTHFLLPAFVFLSKTPLLKSS